MRSMSREMYFRIHALLNILFSFEPTFGAAVASNIGWGNLVSTFGTMVQQGLQTLERGFTILWLRLLKQQ